MIQLSKIKGSTVANQNGWIVTRLLNGKKRYRKTGQFNDGTRINRNGFTRKSINPNPPNNTHTVNFTIYTSDQAVIGCPVQGYGDFFVALVSMYDNAPTAFKWVIELEDN